MEIYLLIKPHGILCCARGRRWTKGKEWADRFFKASKCGLDVQKFLTLCIVTLGIYPLFVGLGCLMLCVVPFLPLPLFIFWQPFRLGGVITMDTMLYVWEMSRVPHHIKKKTGGLPGLIIMFVLGLLFAIVGGTLITVLTAVTTITMPIVYAIFVCFRLFVIAPGSWRLLRTASGMILDDIQKPTKEVCVRARVCVYGC